MAPVAPRPTALIAAAVLALAGCGGDGEQADEGTTGSTTTTPADQLELELVDCHQAGFPTDVDPAAAGERLLPGQELYLVDGRARFTLIAKDCSDIVVDGASQGPGHVSTAWVRVTGPDEVRTFDDAPDVEVSATDYFVPVLFQTDNDGFASAAEDFGVPITRATMAMDPPGAQTRTGSAEDDDGDPPVDYRWTASGGSPLPTGTGVAHVLEGPDGVAGGTLIYDIECPVAGGVFGATTSIEFDPGSGLEDLIGTGYQGVGPDPDLSCQLTITRHVA